MTLWKILYRHDRPGFRFPPYKKFHIHLSEIEIAQQTVKKQLSIQQMQSNDSSSSVETETDESSSDPSRPGSFEESLQLKKSFKDVEL